jgi:hypothetical protein
MVRIEGELGALEGEEERAFAKFVMERPHKFLAQDGGALAYSPEPGEMSADGALSVRLRPDSLELPLLTSLLGEDAAKAIDPTRVVCLLQPEYKITDHHNTLLPLHAG